VLTNPHSYLVTDISFINYSTSIIGLAVISVLAGNNSLKILCLLLKRYYFYRLFGGDSIFQSVIIA